MVIDTGIFIDYLRAGNKDKTTLQNLPDNTDVFVSSVTLYELYMGATSTEKWKDVELLTNGLPVLPISKQVAERAGMIYQELRRSNEMIEFRDIFIAALAMVHGLPVLSRNRKHFRRIKGLMLVKGT